MNVHFKRKKTVLLSIVEKCCVCIDLRSVQSIFSIRKKTEAFCCFPKFLFMGQYMKLGEQVKIN